MIQELFELPIFSHFENGECFYQNNRKSRIFDFKILDIERLKESEFGLSFENLVKSLSTNQRLGIRLEKRSVFEISTSNSRRKAIQKLGYTDYDCKLFVDTFEGQTFLNRKKKSEPNYSTSLNLELIAPALSLRSLSEAECNLQNQFEEIKISNRGPFLDFGTHLVAAVSVINKSEMLSLLNLADLWSRLPEGTELFTSFRRVGDARALNELELLKNRQSSFGGYSRERKLYDIALAHTEIELGGACLLQIEQFALVKAKSETELRTRLEFVKKQMDCLGSVMIETDGVADLFFSSRAGGVPRHYFYDVSTNALSFSPICAFSSPDYLLGNKERSLILHRRDDSIEFFDQFNKNYNAFNAIIVGTTGSGKSVLTNLITQSLYEAPDVQIVKIDVGGSYKKECEYLRGREYALSLDQPTGLNPFAHILFYRENKTYQEFLVHFLCELLKESNELEVSKDLRSEVEEALIAYLSQERAEPTITDFYLSSPPFSRKNLLQRFVGGGLYEHTFTGQGINLDEKYIYFNFETIQGAGSKDFAQAVLGAVILELNMKIYRAGDARKNSGARVALICDETKFFLERNRSFFLFTVSNFRKLGHGVTIINQDLGNFTFTDQNGNEDDSLINSSPIRFFLKAKYSELDLREKYFLNDLQIDAIFRNPHVGSDYREFVLSDDTGTRICKLRLTPEEHLRTSTSQTDNLKISKLMLAVPGLTFEEAIKCVLIY